VQSAKVRFRPAVHRLEDRTAPAAGAFDPSFGVGGQVRTPVPLQSDDQGRSTAIDSLGRIVVAGLTFNGTYGDLAVTRFTSTGVLDTIFGGTGIVTVSFGTFNVFGTGVAIDSFDRIVVVGYTQGLSQGGSNEDFVVARLTAAGALDSSFDGDGKQTVDFSSSADRAADVAIDSLDRIVVAGTMADGSRFAVARLTTAGALDSNFDSDGKQTVDFAGSDAYGVDVTVDSLDRVVVAGSNDNGSNRDFAVARLTAAGALDSSFDGDGKQTFFFGTGDDRAYGVAIDGLGRVVVAGATNNGSDNDFAVARLTDVGALDNNFDGDGKQTIDFGAAVDWGQDVAVDSLNRVVVAGYTDLNNDVAVARLTVAGALDGSFDGDGKQTVTFGASSEHAFGVAIDSLDRVVAVGDTNYGAPLNDFAVVKLTVTGALDSSFDGDGRRSLDLMARSLAFGRAVAVDNLGRTVVAGYTASSTYYDFAISRYTPAGALDLTFGVSGIVRVGIGAFDDHAYAVAIDSLNRVIVAGRTYNGFNFDFAVVRLTVTGTLDASFNDDGKLAIAFGGTDDVAYAVAVDSLNRVVIAGYTATNNDFAVARLTSAGTLDTSFDVDGKQTINFGSSDTGTAVAVDSLDRIVVAGYTGSPSDFAVARLTATGALDTSFDGDGKQTFGFGTLADQANSVAVDSLDRVIVAGNTYNGSNQDFAVARLTDTGALDSSFDSDGKQTVTFGISSEVAYGVAVDSLNRVLVAGDALNPALNDFAVARLTAAGALDSSFDSDGRQTVAFGALDDIAYGVAVTSSNQVVVAGSSEYDGKVFTLARLTGDTTTAVAQVNDGSIQRSRVTSLTVRFSSQVTFSGAPEQAFTLVRTGGGAVNFVASVSVEFGGTVVVLNTFTGPETEFGSLRDGRYTLTALSSQISAGGQALDGDANGTPGGDFVFGDEQGLYRFFGDYNGDRHVDIADFGLFSQSIFNSTNYIAAFDFNNDGHIDIADFGQFSLRLFTVLP
jgi:uncharacterized delta-60 repeat protein